MDASACGARRGADPRTHPSREAPLDGRALHARVPSSHWCVTREDLAEFRRLVRRAVESGVVSPTSLDAFDPGDDAVGPSIFTVNEQVTASCLRGCLPVCGVRHRDCQGSHCATAPPASAEVRAWWGGLSHDRPLAPPSGVVSQWSSGGDRSVRQGETSTEDMSHRSVARGTRFRHGLHGVFRAPCSVTPCQVTERSRERRIRDGAAARPRIVL